MPQGLSSAPRRHQLRWELGDALPQSSAVGVGRRGAVVGAPLLATAASGAAAQPAIQTPEFDYLFFDFASGALPYRRPAADSWPDDHRGPGAVRRRSSLACSAHGGSVGAVRRPPSSDFLARRRRPAADPPRWRHGRRRAELKSVQSMRSTATVRPTGDVHAPTHEAESMYIGGSSSRRALLDEFVARALVEGWADFEGASKRTSSRPVDGGAHCRRSARWCNSGVDTAVRYKDHGVWEASCDATTAAMKAFAAARPDPRHERGTLLAPG